MHPVARNLGHCLRTGQTATDDSLFFCVLTSQQSSHPIPFFSHVFLSSFPLLILSQLNQSPPLRIYSLCVLNSQSLPELRDLTSFPAFPHLMRILSYRDVVSHVSLNASRFFIRATLRGKQALIIVTQLKHAQHALHLMNPSHSSIQAPTTAQLKILIVIGEVGVLFYFNCVTTKTFF